MADFTRITPPRIKGIENWSRYDIRALFTSTVEERAAAAAYAARLHDWLIDNILASFAVPPHLFAGTQPEADTPLIVQHKET